MVDVGPGSSIHGRPPGGLPAGPADLSVERALRALWSVAPHLLTVIGAVISTAALAVVVLVGFPMGLIAVVPLAFGVVATGSGIAWVRRSVVADRGRQRAELHQRALSLAEQHGARLTAAQAVRGLGLSIGDAEALLSELVRAGLAEPEADEAALAVIYRFPGLLGEAHHSPPAGGATMR